MGKKTIFNLIGPLSSPAQVKRQVIGVFDKKWMKPFAEALKENNVVHAYIVHSDDGMDEISPFEKTNVVELLNLITGFMSFGILRSLASLHFLL